MKAPGRRYVAVTVIRGITVALSAERGLGLLHLPPRGLGTSRGRELSGAVPPSPSL